jgi:hypothetical protein
VEALHLTETLKAMLVPGEEKKSVEQGLRKTGSVYISLLTKLISCLHKFFTSVKRFLSYFIRQVFHKKKKKAQQAVDAACFMYHEHVQQVCKTAPAYLL